MVGTIAQKFAQLVTGSFVGFIRSRHSVGLIHNYQIPMDLPEPWKDVFSLGQVKGGQDLPLFQPLVHAELVTDVVPFKNHEFFIKFFFEFPLPLKSEIGRADDQNPLNEPSKFKFPDEKAGHDRLSSPGIIGQEEADSGEFEEVVIDRFELMG